MLGERGPRSLELIGVCLDKTVTSRAHPGLLPPRRARNGQIGGGTTLILSLAALSLAARAGGMQAGTASTLHFLFVFLLTLFRSLCRKDRRSSVPFCGTPPLEPSFKTSRVPRSVPHTPDQRRSHIGYPPRNEYAPMPYVVWWEVRHLRHHRSPPPPATTLGRQGQSVGQVVERMEAIQVLTLCPCLLRLRCSTNSVP